MPLLFFERGMKDEYGKNYERSWFMFDWICRRIYPNYTSDFKICVKERLD